MGGENGGRRGKGCQEHVQRTQQQSQRGVGSRVGGGDGWGAGDWWGKMETTVLEQ